MQVHNLPIYRPSHLSLTENVICSHLVLTLVRLQYEIGVHDGEERALALGRHTPEQIMEHVGATDETILKVLPSAKGGKMSFIRLIHGNDEDVISDYGVSLEPTLKPVLRWIDETLC